MYSIFYYSTIVQILFVDVYIYSQLSTTFVQQVSIKFLTNNAIIFVSQRSNERSKIFKRYDVNIVSSKTNPLSKKVTRLRKR